MWTSGSRLCSMVVVVLLAASAPRAQSGSPPEQAAAPAGGRIVRLGLRQAIDLALSRDGSARIQLAEQLVRQSRSRLMQSRGALLPSLDSSLVQQNQTRNLAAFGIRFAFPIPGFQIPETVGPFDVFDARLTLNQSLFDLGAIRRFQASRAGVGLAETEQESASDAVAAQVARAYVGTLRAQARVEAVQANVVLAETLANLARNQKDAGTGTGIEVTRAQVQLLNERQRLLVADSEGRQSLLQLARIIGLDLDVRIEPVDRLAYSPTDPLIPEQAVQAALQTRADLKAQQQREESARLAYSAVRSERVPSLVGFADYGTIGSRIGDASPTRTFGVSLRVPIYDGGRRDARRAESQALLEQERIKTRDLRRQIQLEVLVALDNLRSADEQVKVAGEGVQLSEEELAQARRRYEAGMTSSIEVADAQTRRERASDSRIAALFSYHLAQISLGEAMGTLRRIIR